MVESVGTGQAGRDSEPRAADPAQQAGSGPPDALTKQSVDLITSAASGDQPVERILAALTALRNLRASLDRWEPRLIAAAREAGASWAQLAGALGVASRQAAERRYLRLHQPDHESPGATRDQRVQAVRDRRAGDRAVSEWARTHGADLRQLAGQITALTDLGPEAQPSIDRLHQALAGDDAAALVPLLAAAHEHLPAEHAALADRVADIGRRVRQVRQDSHDSRQNRRSNAAGRSNDRPGQRRDSS